MQRSWKEFLTRESEIEFSNTDPEERVIRKAISELRKQGIIYIPIRSMYQGFRKYIKFEDATEEQKQSYAKSRARSLYTQYVNTLLPVKSAIKDERLLALMGALGEMT